MSANKTPVMQQHAAAKLLYPDAVVLFRLGDFYEMFGDDAVLCSRVLELTLTSRNKGKSDEIPMAGVPHHAAHSYIGRLLRAGHKVAICEQMADPSTVKGIVPRQVVRVITPGTVTHTEHLDSTANNWLFAIEVGTSQIGVAQLDLSTGELFAGSADSLAVLMGELARSAPREVLIGAAAEAPTAFGGLENVKASISSLLAAPLRVDREQSAAEQSLELEALPGETPALAPVGSSAVARALRFARECNPGQVLPITRVLGWNPAQELVLDPTAQAHLELVSSASGDKKATLLGVIDFTSTVLGARLLRRRLLAPLLDVEQIRRRLDAVEIFVLDSGLRGEVRTALGRVTDLERLSVRAALGEASPRDLGALRDGLMAARDVVGSLATLENAIDRSVLGVVADIDVVNDVAELLERALVERPPVLAKEGAIFRAEFDRELKDLDALRTHGTERVVELEARLKAETDIPTLKARYTRVFGWYLEVSKTHIARVPKTWRRKQTIAGGERYTVDELDELSEKIASAEELHRARELELLKELLAVVRAAAGRVAGLSARIAAWDCAVALAEAAHRYDYCRPLVDAEGELVIVEGRHPVVEQLAARAGFIRNDVELRLDVERFWVITGPNMAGKSTLLRQVALITILAQMGSFVPAKSAKIGLVDRVLSRVGASDNLAQGESTFMVEMRETAQILRSATRRSLVILDEIGRGTSTFDGLAIAWAVAEYLDEVVGCRALFATHYHELTALAEEHVHVANYSVSAKEVGDDIVFLHRLTRGAASRSYGVAVAKLAGLPEAVLARAQALLMTLESQGSAGGVPKTPRATKKNQLSLFETQTALDKSQREVLDSIKALDVNRLTPLEALQFIAQLKVRL